MTGRLPLRLGRAMLGSLVEARRDPLGFLSRVTADNGDIVRFTLAGAPVYLLNDPEDIEKVLVTEHHRFVKGWSLKGARRLFGDGLLTSDGDSHIRQRRAAQPAFQRERLAAYTAEAIALAARHAERWQSNETLDITTEMSRLTLTIAARTLVGAQGDALAAAAYPVITDAVDYLEVPALPFAVALDLLHPMRSRRFRAARRALYDLLNDIVEHRGDEDRGDVLSLLMSAGLRGPLLRDEMVTLLLAGHDTMGHALAWTWLLVGRDEAAGQRLRDEVDAALGPRAPTSDDVPGLAFAKAVFAETMRLYPPAWVLGRVTIEPHEVRSNEIPRGALVVMSPWVVHRREKSFAEPSAFNPDRWLDANQKDRPRFAYFPFGGGPRGCMGEMLAWTQGVAILATIAQRWDLRASSPSLPTPHPGLTLRPTGQTYVRAIKR